MMSFKRLVLLGGLLVSSALIALISINSHASAQTGSTSTPTVHYPVDHLAEQQYWAQRHGNVTAAGYQAALKQAHQLPEVAQLPPSNRAHPQGISPAAYSGWTSIGPAPIGTTPDGGVAAGRATSIAIDPTTSGANTVIYLGTANGGVWKSTNNGASWHPLTDKQVSLATGALAIDPNNHNIIYAGTGEPNQGLDNYKGFGILKSTDAGTTWTLLGNATFGNLNTAFSRIVIDPRTGKIFAASTIGLYVSADNGSTWTAASAPLTSAAADDLAINSTTNPSTLYTIIRGVGLYRSIDGGTTWGQLTTGLPAGNTYNRSVIAISPSQPSTVYVIISNGSTVYTNGTYNGGYYSNDSGNTWSPMLSLNTDFSGSEPWYALELAVDPHNPTLVYGGGLDVWYTPNAQAASGNWVQSSDWHSSTSLHADQHNMMFAPGCTASPCGLYFVNDGGIDYSATANTSLQPFTDLNTAPLAVTEFTGGDLGVNFHTTPSALGGAQDNGADLYTNSTVWSENAGGDGGWSQIDWSNTQYMYTQYIYAATEQSTNSGASFGDAATGLNTTNSGGALFYSPLVLDRTNGNHLATGDGHAVFETINARSTISWYKGSQTFGTAFVSALAISPNNGAVIYAGLDDGSLYKTTSGGSGSSSTYTALTALNAGYIDSITFDAADTSNQTLIVTTGQTTGASGSIFKTTDGGLTWANITGTLPVYPIDSAVVYHSGSTRVIVVGTDYGVYFTTNDGTTWTGLNMGLPNVAITDLAIDQAQTTIAAFTHGRSVWTIAVPTLGAAPIDSIGIYRPSTQSDYLRLHNTTGYADFSASFHPGTVLAPVVGDWTGSGYDTIGALDQSNGDFTLCNANTTSACSNSANLIQFTLGIPNDTPLSGRWINSATHDGAGVYRPTNGILYLKNALTTGYADHALVMGIPGDAGVAGDWTGKGFDSPGIYRPSVTGFYLSNQVTDGVVYADFTVTYGNSTDLPIVGDWIGQGHDGVGMFRPSNGYAYLRNSLTTGYADNSFFYGAAGDLPMAGHWQAIYPPIAPPPVMIAKTAIPSQGGRIVPGDNQIGG